MYNNFTPIKKLNKYRNIRKYFWLEFFIYWLGGSNCSELVRPFAVSRQTLQNTLLNNLKSCSSFFSYNKHNHLYEFDGSFSDLAFSRTSTDKLLKIVEAENIFAELDFSPMVNVPIIDVSVTAIPRTELIRYILSAIHKRKSLDVHYHSKAGGEVSIGVFSPHAIVKTSSRYHCRGFWQVEGRVGHYSDLVISRMTIDNYSDATYVSSENDLEWNCFANLEISIKHDIPQPISDALEIEHGGNSFHKSTRKALAYYVIREIENRRVYGYDSKLYDVIEIT